MKEKVGIYFLGIRRLDLLRCPSHRHLAEFWIGANNPKVKCLHQSGINVYERHLHRYHESKYRSLDIA
jgi:hypothetical protein